MTRLGLLQARSCDIQAPKRWRGQVRRIAEVNGRLLADRHYPPRSSSRGDDDRSNGMSETVDSTDASFGTIALVGQLIDTLVTKGVLTAPEGREVVNATLIQMDSIAGTHRNAAGAAAFLRLAFN